MKDFAIGRGALGQKDLTTFFWIIFFEIGINVFIALNWFANYMNGRVAW